MTRTKKGLAVGSACMIASVGLYTGAKAPQIREAYDLAVDTNTVDVEAMTKQVTKETLTDYPGLAVKVKDIETTKQEYVDNYGSSTDFPPFIGVLGAIITTDYEKSPKYMHEQF